MSFSLHSNSFLLLSHRSPSTPKHFFLSPIVLRPLMTTAGKGDLSLATTLPYFFFCFRSVASSSYCCSYGAALWGVGCGVVFGVVSVMDICGSFWRLLGEVSGVASCSCCCGLLVGLFFLDGLGMFLSFLEAGGFMLDACLYGCRLKFFGPCKGWDDGAAEARGLFAANFKRDEGMNLLKGKQALQRLTETAEKAKMELSSLTQTNISLPFITATTDGPKHIETTITRAKFEELCSDLLDR
ncbi:uncharacterized protein LOC116120767 [Pistacia vera]|uniref:uncharacterized protein LOC116120767 n=1 Tax=Pistacia vera TaxID=55513 RepID=UPI0012633E3D|nr:uncharacterized protein LOC116120767 [Pistacia vera]